MIKTLKNWIILVLAAAVAVLVVVMIVRNHGDKDKGVTVETAPARINRVKALAELTTVEIYSEVPVVDTVNNKVLYGIQKQAGNISFDIENLRIDDSGDTVRVKLPKEKIELYESTDDNAWEVVDTKNLKLFGSGKLSAEEDNIIKRKVKARSESLLYENGTVARARQEAKRNLTGLLTSIYRRPVVVTD